MRFNIITPIHAPKFAKFVYQNQARIGSQGISDSRTFAKTDVYPIRAMAESQGISTNPSTASTFFSGANEMITTIKTKGGPIEVNWEAAFTNNQAAGAGRTYFQVFVNGNAYGPAIPFDTPNAASTICASAGKVSVPVPAGVWTVQVMWRLAAGTSVLIDTNRGISVREGGV